MSDFELNFLFNLGRHPVKLPENKTIQQFRFPLTVENKTGRASPHQLLPDNSTQLPLGITSAMSQRDRTISRFPVTRQQ